MKPKIVEKNGKLKNEELFSILYEIIDESIEKNYMNMKMNSTNEKTKIQNQGEMITPDVIESSEKLRFAKITFAYLLSEIIMGLDAKILKKLFIDDFGRNFLKNNCTDLLFKTVDGIIYFKKAIDNSAIKHMYEQSQKIIRLNRIVEFYKLTSQNTTKDKKQKNTRGIKGKFSDAKELVVAIRNIKNYKNMTQSEIARKLGYSSESGFRYIQDKLGIDYKKI